MNYNRRCLGCGIKIKKSTSLRYCKNCNRVYRLLKNNIKINLYNLRKKKLGISNYTFDIYLSIRKNDI